MTIESSTLVDWNIFARARTELGAGFIRILGYFREDGVKSVDALERAAQNHNAAAMVIPAHTLKGESLQFGAEPLAALAESIELAARYCVETRDAPTGLIEHIVKLRPLFDQTLALLEQEANPLVERRSGGFGRRAGLNGYGHE
ncbi:Hpt domain-containing protein [uncultured Sphingomonas sp.]|uniref:Hpt domain-containing protein n=1 Tax=uncultured Sphingomonas sp. TaxID=158754 RepID=UPI00261E0500|nr:Hpt domain-containing protein [uncultured Sphingomonas sp.]